MAEQVQSFRLLTAPGSDCNCLTRSSTIKLELESKPQSVAIARGMLSAVLELLRFGAEVLDDVKMAVSEACNNVVLHAYGDGIGPLLVELELTRRALGVTVRDRGIGIAASAPAEGRLGVGIPMMQTLAERALFRAADGGGTEVRLEFRSEMPAPVWFDAPAAKPKPNESLPTITGEVVVIECPLPLLASVIGRLATIVAAEARFSIDRLSDVRLLTDAIAAQLEATSSRPVGFALARMLRRLELRLGPLDPGAGAALLAGRESPSPTSLPLGLADEWGTEELSGYELVHVVITESGPE